MKALRGAGWTIGWRVATRFLGLLSTLFLVRLLTPADFGLVSLAYGLLTSLDAMVALGVEQAIVRIDQPGREIYDAGFTLEVARAVVTGAVLSLAASYAGAFFSDPRLAFVIYALSAGWVIAGFSNTGMVEYRRTMAFDMEFKAKIIPRICSVAVTILAAATWHSYWALIFGILTGQILGMALSYKLHPYRPRFSTAAINQIFAFSYWEWLISIVAFLGGRADTMVVGRLAGTAAVGVYGVGAEIALLPTGEIVSPLCRALFSGFVAEQRDGGDVVTVLTRVLGLLALTLFPISVGLSLEAYPITRLFLGEEWLAAVPVIQILALVGMTSLIGSICEALFSASAWLRTLLGVAVGLTVFRIALLLVLVPSLSLIGAALATAAFTVAQEIVYLVIASRRAKVRMAALLGCLARPAVAAAVMAAVLYWLGLGWTSGSASPTELVGQLALAIPLGAAIYVVALVVCWSVGGRPPGAETALITSLDRVIGPYVPFR